MNINVASIANAIVIYLYFHLKMCQTVANSGSGLKQLWNWISRLGRYLMPPPPVLI